MASKNTMTRKQREQVVELLRCGADLRSITAAGYALGHCDGINPCTSVFVLAVKAYTDMPDVIHAGGYHAWPHSCLEAAQRVEEGSWPP